MAGPTTTVDADVAAFVAGGVAIVAATRDDALRPDIARGWGPLVAPGGAAMTLCVGLYPASRARANLEANGAIAVTFSLPTSYRGVQIKGVARTLREPTEAERERVAAHLEAFVADAAQLGVSPEGSRQLLEPELLAVDVEVSEVYDQTPGPRAGSRL